MPIKILDNSLINKIAAGEVIERPESVVKELLENSLDAKADEITIEVVDSGLRKIKITDNGEGMRKDDLRLSYKRHATSKIENEYDLLNINSLGFRGEALASIAEISNIKISSKKETEQFGHMIEVESGKMIREQVMAIPDGTTIEITDLFFNVPARKNYLKSLDFEFNKILQTVMNYALINENVSIKLIKDGKEVLNSGKSKLLLDRIILLYGSEIAKNLIPINYKEQGIEIFGYTSKPYLTRSDKSDQSIYVNKRIITNNVISTAVYDAYKSALFVNRHPVFILTIKINPSEIDVNVHPAKKTIRLKDEELVYTIVYKAIVQAFRDVSLIPSVNLETSSSAKPNKDYPFSLDAQSTLKVKEEPYEYKIKQTIKEPEQKRIGPFRILGQINKTFIVAETSDGLAIIDQHAAEERVNYEKFMKEKSEHAIKKQRLFTPKIIELNPFQYRVATNNKKLLNEIGYEFEEFGENAIKLNSVPEIFGRLKSVLLIDIINELEKNSAGIIQEDIEERIIRFACRASVKAGEELTTFQIKELLDNLGKCDNPYTCPHGRPTIINFNISNLEKKFKRSGW
jgi:DNA mismatch repair protein MutL